MSCKKTELFGSLEDQLTLRVIENELGKRLQTPATVSVKSIADFHNRAYTINIGYINVVWVLGLGKGKSQREISSKLSPLLPSSDLVVAGDDFVLDMLNSLISSSGVAIREGKIRVVPDPCLLTSHLFDADVLNSRLGWLKLMGWYPPTRSVIALRLGAVLQKDSQTLIGEIVKLLFGDDELSLVLLPVNPVDSGRYLEEVEAKEQFIHALDQAAPGRCWSLPDIASAIDIVACLAGSSRVISSYDVDAVIAHSLGIGNITVLSKNNSDSTVGWLEESYDVDGGIDSIGKFFDDLAQMVDAAPVHNPSSRNNKQTGSRKVGKKGDAKAKDDNSRCLQLEKKITRLESLLEAKALRMAAERRAMADRVSELERRLASQTQARHGAESELAMVLNSRWFRYARAGRRICNLLIPPFTTKRRNKKL
ncbi:MAG: hypothetical protein M1483_04060 [Actinobacteria bacterium]|nr:hypothetical protein [Actinomycetota bacterium]MCL6104794.1 hypothetical protein [Actinomycetota bacterium]